MVLLILNNYNKILNNRDIFRIPNFSCATLRSTLKGIVNFLHITALGIIFNLGVIKLTSYP